jgi:arginine/ornithine transport system substrate-binding protein
MLRRTAFAALLALSAAAQAQAPDWKKIRIGVEGAYPPFSELTPSGELKGFDIDIARALCARMKAECTLVQQDFDGMIPGLMARKFDAVVASMSITEERKRQVAFSDRYYNTPARFIVKNGSGIAITVEGLKGRKIGVQRSTIHDRYATDTFKGAQIVRYTKQDEVYLDLAAGRIDATLQDVVAADVGFLKTRLGQGFGFVGPTYSDPKYFGDGSGIAMRKADTALHAKINAAIKALRADGGYKQLQDKYFDFDIYGE